MVIKRSILISFLSFYSWSNSGVVFSENNFTSDPVVIQMPDLTGYSTEEQAFLNNAAEIIKQKLAYHAHVKFSLPDTAFDEADDQIVNFDNLFKRPNSSEVSSLAYDAQGNRQLLTQEQMKQVRQDGAFVIPSKEYPGQNHVWKLSLLIQKGAKNIQVSFDKDMGNALSQIIIQIPEKLCGEGFSVKTGFSRIYKGLRGSLAAFVGLIERKPKYGYHEVSRIINELQENYTAKELMAQKEHYAAAQPENETSFAVDMRLYDKKLGEKLAPLVAEINRSFLANWDKTYHSLRMEQKALIKASGITKESLLEEQLERKMALIREDMYSKALLADKALEEKAPGYAKLLINHQLAVRVSEQVEKNLTQIITMQEEVIAYEVKRKHPKLALSEEWFSNKVKELSSEFYREIRWDHLMTTPLYLESIGLFQEAFVYRKIIDFQKNAEERIRKELEAEEVPASSFEFQKRIWNSSNWIIESFVENHADGSKDLKFFPHMYEETKIDTNMPFWRIRYAANESHANFKNGLYSILVSNLWNGPVGLRSLLGTHGFYANKTIDSKTGKVIDDSRSYQDTFGERIQNIWKNVFAAREQFESAPDTGFLGKRYTRWLNQFLQYGVKGMGGTIAVAVGQPVLTALNLAFSTAAVATAPVWAPLSSMFRLGYNATIYDTLHPESSDSRYLFPVVGYMLSDIGFHGIGQATLAGAAAAVVHPTLAAIHGLYGASRKIIRTAYDATAAKLFLKHGRWPASDSFLAYRIAGPGLSSNYFFQIKPEIALVALQAKLESLELSAYKTYTEAEIQRPLKEYSDYMKRLLAGLSMQVGTDLTAAKLAKVAAEQQKDLNKLLEKREKFLSKLLRVNFSAIRLEKEDLEKTLELAEKLTHSFYEERLKGKIDDKVLEKLWADADSAEGDYLGLSKSVLSRIFTDSFLEPLEVTDETFVIHIEDKNLFEKISALTSRPVAAS